MKCSIAIATRNHDSLLHRTLQSIFLQKPSFECEVIIVSDGSTDETERVVYGFKGRQFPLKYLHLDNPVYRNPSVARNTAYKMCRGDILILQSDDVFHTQLDCISRLVDFPSEEGFHLATVHNYDTYYWSKMELYVGPGRPRPYFFLGAIARKHIYAIGGNCEEFTKPGFEDDWFAECLTRGLGLRVCYSQDIMAYHQHHDRPTYDPGYDGMADLYRRKVAEGVFVGGPAWHFEPGIPAVDFPYVG